jgi:hypothetical protein
MILYFCAKGRVRTFTGSFIERHVHSRTTTKLSHQIYIWRVYRTRQLTSTTFALCEFLKISNITIGWNDNYFTVVI